MPLVLKPTGRNRKNSVREIFRYNFKPAALNKKPGRSKPRDVYNIWN